MILVVFAALCVASVPLTGGHLGRLAHIQLRGLWLAAVAIGIQIAITTFAAGGSHSFNAALHIVSYVFAGLFLWANRRLPGAPLIAAGAGSNALAIVVNGGVMPASPTAERIAGLKLGHAFNNSAPIAHAHLTWLGDIIPFPGPAPLHNVLSVGDCVLYLGMLVLLHVICRRPVESPTASAESAPTPSPKLSAPAAASLSPALAGPRLTASRRRPRPRSAVLTPVGIGMAGFVVAVGLQSLLAARER